MSKSIQQSLSVFFKKLPIVKYFFKNRKKNQQDQQNSIWEDDLLEHQQIAQDLTNVITTLYSDTDIIALNMKCNTGRTFFLKHWTKSLMAQQEIALYYNAWNINSIDQLLTPFIHFIFSQLCIVGNIKNSTIKNFQSISNALFSFNTFNKIINKSPLGMFSVFFEVTKDAVDKSSSNIAMNDLTVFVNKEKSINAFKKQFLDIINEIRKKNNHKKIYIMIDELDYCRPKATIEFLENLKYIFNMPGLVFIIGVDTNIINSYINVLYSGKINSNYYFNDLIDFTLNFPASYNIDQYISKLCKNFLLNISLNNKHLFQELLIASFKLHCTGFSLSIKEINICLNKIKCIINSSTVQLIPNLLSFLIILSFVDNNLYQSLNSTEFKSVISAIETKLQPMLNMPEGKNEWETIQILLQILFNNTEINTTKLKKISNSSPQLYSYLLKDKNLNKMLDIMKNIAIII